MGSAISVLESVRRSIRHLSVLALIPCASGYSATTTSLASGNWSDPAIWSVRLPTAGDNAVIASGTVVTVNVNTASVNDIVTQGGATLQGDGTGKILRSGSGNGEDLTNSGTLNLGGPNRARLLLAASSRWGGTGGTWILDTLDLNLRTLSFMAGSSFTVTFTGNGTSILNVGTVGTELRWDCHRCRQESGRQ